jgi:hypothetical protein
MARMAVVVAVVVAMSAHLGIGIVVRQDRLASGDVHGAHAMSAPWRVLLDS